MKTDPSARSPFDVTGSPPEGGFGKMPDLPSGDIELIDGNGIQTSQHPAKNQKKIMRFFGD